MDEQAKKTTEWFKTHIKTEKGYETSVLEKQIPKKPITDGITAKEFCPNCKKQLRTFVNVENNFFTGYIRERIYPNYCEDCGQAIDWEEIDVSAEKGK